MKKLALDGNMILKKICLNIVPLDELNQIIKRSNMDLVNHLPVICEYVGLKIVERY